MKTGKTATRGINPNRYILTSEERFINDRGAGMEIYLAGPAGERHYLVNHRRAPQLHSLLHRGVTLGEILRLKYSASKGAAHNREQLLLHQLNHLADVARDFIQYELYDLAAA